MTRLFGTELSERGRRYLTLANLGLLAVILVHDGDHMRQARQWCYAIPTRVWLLNLLVYVPNGMALLLARLRRRAAAGWTAAGGIFIAAGFAKVHLLGTGTPWGIWQRSFFQLHVDGFSWSLLILTVLCGIATALLAAYVIVTEDSGSVPLVKIPRG